MLFSGDMKIEKLYIIKFHAKYMYTHCLKLSYCIYTKKMEIRKYLHFSIIKNLILPSFLPEQEQPRRL